MDGWLDDSRVSHFHFELNRSWLRYDDDWWKSPIKVRDVSRTLIIICAQNGIVRRSEIADPTENDQNDA